MSRREYPLSPESAEAWQRVQGELREAEEALLPAPDSLIDALMEIPMQAQNRTQGAPRTQGLLPTLEPPVDLPPAPDWQGLDSLELPKPSATRWPVLLALLCAVGLLLSVPFRPERGRLDLPLTSPPQQTPPSRLGAFPQPSPVPKGARELCLEGEAALKGLRFREALRCAERALRRKPGYPLALQLRADASSDLRTQKWLDQARRALGKKQKAIALWIIGKTINSLRPGSPLAQKVWALQAQIHKMRTRPKPTIFSLPNPFKARTPPHPRSASKSTLRRAKRIIDEAEVLVGIDNSEARKYLRRAMSMLPMGSPLYIRAKRLFSKANAP